MRIAGILNEKGNVPGLMPRPERVCDPLLGGTDRRPLFESLVDDLPYHSVDRPIVGR